MNEEKSMTEYNEKKGLFQWIKARFEKLKEKFRPKKEIKKEFNEGPGITAEDLDVVKGDYPNPSVLNFDELEAEINNLEEKRTWELTEEEKLPVQEGFEEIRARNNNSVKDGQELLQEELDNITAGYPIIDEK